MEKRRKLLGPVEIVSLILGLGILAYLGWNSGGEVVHRSETITVHDKPRDVKKKPSVFKEEQADQSVELMLRELADHFSEKPNSSEAKADKPTKTSKQLTDDEAKFYESVKKKKSLSDQVQNSADWLRVLRTSQKTYSKVRSILNESGGQAVQNPENVNEVLEEGSASDSFYKNLSRSFDISEEDLKAFSRTGKNAISDWAEYIQSKQEEEKN